MARRRRTVIGFLPRLGRGTLTLGWWVIRHPQPILAVALVLGAGLSLMRYMQRTEAFRIARVAWSPASSLELREPLVGQNLWALDIRALAQSLHAQQPWLKRVRVVRELPQTIRIDTVERQPIAQLRMRRWYPIDVEGFILPQGSPQPLDQLPRVRGLERSGATFVIGAVNEVPRLVVALRVLGTLERHPAMARHRVTEINVTEPRQIRFMVDFSADADGTESTGGGLMEVRCGAEEALAVQLDRLQRAFKVMARQGMTHPRYVDVRFEEPVIGPST